MSNLYKVFSKIILNRVTLKLDEQQPVEQAGFRAGFSTTDHMHTLKQLIQKAQEYNKSIYLAFVDYSKAFDSLAHNSIWKALKHQGIEQKYIRIIRNVYTNSTAQIKLETLGDEFRILRGVRQGDPLSPKIFSAVLEEVFRGMEWQKYGININGTLLNHLRFADDLVLISDNHSILQKMLQELAEGSIQVGLSMNKEKTKVMTNSIEETISIEGESIDYVNSYIYLGQLISFDKQMEQEIERRITSAWNRYWSLKEIMKNEQYPIISKRKLFNTCILPCLTYGCETWALTRKILQKITSCQRGMERSILNFKRKDKKRAKDLRKITKVKDATFHTKSLKWRWAGHMLRDKNNKWSKALTEWQIRDGSKRSRGRQRKRWDDDIVEIAGALWARATRDRDKWRSLGEAYASRDALMDEDAEVQ